MKLAALLVSCACVFGADAARLSFTKTFVGSAPPFFAIVVAPDGKATYNESTDPDNAEAIQLETRVVTEMFALADKLEHFKNPLESGLKVANMGMKVLRWEENGQGTESKFNYTSSEDAKLLSDWFERIAESERQLLELKRATKHDRLGVDAAIVGIQTLWNNRRLVGTPQFLPVLDEVAGNEVYIHMARERAAQIADAIRARDSK